MCKVSINKFSVKKNIIVPEVQVQIDNFMTDGGSASAGGAGIAMRPMQGDVPTPCPEPLTLTFTNCGCSAIRNTNIDEWYNISDNIMRWSPHCLNGRPAKVQEISTYEFYKPVSVEYELFDVEVVGEVGPTQFSGHQQSVQLLIYEDKSNLYGPCADTLKGNESITDIHSNERSLHNGFDMNNAIFFPKCIKLPRGTNLIHPFETCGEVTMINCNMGETYSYNYKCDAKYPKHVCEWWMQPMPTLATEKCECRLFRFDYFNYKVVRPMRNILSACYGRKTYDKNGIMFCTPSEVETFTFFKQAADKTWDRTQQPQPIKASLFNEDGEATGLPTGEAQKWANFFNYQNLSAMEDVSEHNPMKHIFIKLNPSVGAQGNMTTLYATYHWKIKYTFQFYGKFPESSVAWNRVSEYHKPGENTPQIGYQSRKYECPKQPYAIPMYFYQRDYDHKKKKLGKKRLYPNIADNMAMQNKYPYIEHGWYPMPELPNSRIGCYEPRSTTMAPLITTTKKPGG